MSDEIKQMLDELADLQAEYDPIATRIKELEKEIRTQVLALGESVSGETLVAQISAGYERVGTTISGKKLAKVLESYGLQRLVKTTQVGPSVKFRTRGSGDE